MKNLPELPQNAVSELTIHGLATDTQQVPVPLTLSPGHRIPGTVYIHDLSRFNRPDGVPERPPSTLPTPANLHLKLTLDKKIAHGGVGTVFACVVDDACSAATANYYIPPLVVKIAIPPTARDIAREAWFYEEMEALQGVVIPRCYGFFVAEVPDSLDIPTWKDDMDYWDKKQPRELSILVLERLGERLPVGEEFPPGLEDEIYNMYEELSERGILHSDIRWHNILSAPESPPGLPGRPSASSNRVYGWRLVDFDRSEKSGTTTKHMFSLNDQYLRHLLTDLPNGFIFDGPRSD